MDETAARRVLLARAIETTDTKGELLAAAERDQVDLRARQDALHRGEGRVPMRPHDFVHLRAQHVLGAVGVHHPSIAAMQEPRAWQAWLAWLVPLVAFLAGVGSDAIGNPHRVDLISLPLLGIVVWNLAMYVVLFVHAVLPRKEGKSSWLANVGRWSEGAHALHRRAGDVRTQAAVRFHMDWFAATQGLHVERMKRVLHLSAAAWAAGVIVSLLVRGLVVEYRVGWESTFLGPAQVHALLEVLRLPALLVFPFDTFDVIDVAQLRFSDGGGARAGAPWVWMYVALLVTVVIVPRLLLATFAAWREDRLSRSIRLDLKEPYFERIAALLSSTRIELALLVHREGDRERFLRAIGADAQALPTLMASPLGDVMRLVDLPAASAAPQPASEPEGWFVNWRRKLGFGAPDANAASSGFDAILHVVGEPRDEDSGRMLLQAHGAPVVTLTPGLLPNCWIQDVAFLAAIANALPAERRKGFARIVRAWEAAAEDRLNRSMLAIADHLLLAATQVEEVHAGSLSVKSLRPAEREAQAHAQRVAMERIVKRIDESAASMTAQVRRIHGVDEAAGAAMEHRLEERFVVQQPVDASQAGMAGAATGAAMGASVDLLAGGLTLGAAAALGAVVGGGAAFIAAAWKNRASPTGATIVQLSDGMLEALVEAALLRYVAIVHWARGVPDVDARWKTEVAARVPLESALLAGYWATARTQSSGEKALQPLAGDLARIAKAVLMHMYPQR